MLFKRLKAGLKAARLWNGALDCAAQGDFAHGLEKLRSIESLQIKHWADPATSYGIQIRLLKAFLLIKIEKYSEAIATLRGISWSTKGFRIDTLKYLRGYESLILSAIPKVVLANGVQTVEAPIEYEEINLSLVPSHIKQKFPLRSHPDWKN